MPEKKKEKGQPEGNSAASGFEESLITTRVLVDTMIKVKMGSTKAELQEAAKEMRRVGKLVMDNLDETIEASKGKFNVNITEPITNFGITSGTISKSDSKETEPVLMLTLPEQNLSIPFTLNLAMKLSHIWPEAVRSIIGGAGHGKMQGAQGILIIGTTGNPDNITS